MSKTFRAWDVDQVWLLPPSVHDFVPPGHPAHLVRELVRRELDLAAILAEYDEARGQPPYHPAMMTALLLYAFSQGLYASRRIARGCEERLDLMAVTGLQRPDFRTISDFRKRHLAALAGLFGQVLRLCRQAGLVRLGHVALDGTRLTANASKHKAMSYGRMAPAEAALAAEVEGWLARAAREDAADDAAHGSDRRGDELPAWVADRQARLERIRAAKAALEGEAKAAPPPPDAEPGPSSGMSDHGRPRRAQDGGPPDRAQRNFTDPDSRILKTRNGFIQGYNGQLALDAGHQIIIAQRLTTNGSDQAGLIPLLDAARGARHPRLSRLRPRGPRRIRSRRPAAAQARQQDGGDGRQAPARRPALALSVAQADGRAGDRPDQAGARLRQFLLRGFSKVEAEWALICTAHNLTKLLAARRARPRSHPNPRSAMLLPITWPSLQPMPSERPITWTGS